MLPPTPNDEEVDLLALAKELWFGRRTIINSLIVFCILGLTIAFTASKEYVATTIMVPSIGSNGSSSLGGLGGLAAMAGINLNAPSGGELSPTVYPKIIASLPFQLELIKTPLKFKDLKEQVTFFDYYTKILKPNPFLKYTIGLPNLILGIPGNILSIIKGNDKVEGISPKNQNPIELSIEEQSAIAAVSGMISLNVNTKDGIITLTSTMPEALAAAQLGQRAQYLLQQFIIENKIKKAKANLDFIQQRFDETAKKYEELQLQLATFNDRNKNVSLATAKTEEVRLTSQYNLIFNIYSELAKQLEQAKIQVKQDTPIFTIIEPISVPNIRSKPNRPIILLTWLFLGSFFGILLVFTKRYAFPILIRIKENKK